MPDIVTITSLTHSYPPARKQQESRKALNDLSLSMKQGEIFCLLGPNGSGKSTLFRILSTLLKPTSGSVRMFGTDLVQHPEEVRRSIGVVFQHPSLDIKLTARENLLHQGHLYGLRGNQLSQRINATLSQVGIIDRGNDLVENLSGGMQRRVELAKSLLHSPPLLLLDEPSTGLDPGARRDFSSYLETLRTTTGVTALLTTHILDEAERCDRLAILDQGNLVALGTPDELKREIGSDIITITCKDPTTLCDLIRKRFTGTPQLINQTIRFERQNGHEFIPQLVEAFPGQIDTITLSKPTLEDVFIKKTGHTFWQNEQTSP
jgi:ABC-2 type transport system ATP-binding protein